MMQATNDEMCCFFWSMQSSAQGNELIDFRRGGLERLFGTTKSNKMYECANQFKFQSIGCIAINKEDYTILIRCHFNKRAGLQTGCMMLMHL